MGNLLLRTQFAFDNCKGHLDTSNAWGSEIESYLTQHVLVIMCADVQQEIYGVVEQRAGMADDADLMNYAVATCKRVLRSIGKSEIAGFIGHFSADAKKYLNDNINDAEVTIYSNAVSGRHNIAHGTGANITFRELEDAISVARKLIAIVLQAISPNTAVT